MSRKDFMAGYKAGKMAMRKQAFGQVEDWVTCHEEQDFRNGEFGDPYYTINWKAVGSVSLEEAREFAELILDMCENPAYYG